MKKFTLKKLYANLSPLLDFFIDEEKEIIYWWEYESEELLIGLFIDEESVTISYHDKLDHEDNYRELLTPELFVDNWECISYLKHLIDEWMWRIELDKWDPAELLNK